MSDPIDDNEETKRTKRTEGESGSGSATSGFIRASSDGVARSSETDANEQKRKKTGEGEGEAGALVGGVTRASGEGIVKLTVEQTKKVWADFRHLDLNEVVASVAEFFSEFPARASANLSVVWGPGSFAIINMAIKFGQDVAMAVRERTRESAVSVKRKYGINIKFKGRTGMAVVAPNPQGAGLS